MLLEPVQLGEDLLLGPVDEVAHAPHLQTKNGIITYGETEEKRPRNGSWVNGCGDFFHHLQSPAAAGALAVVGHADDGPRVGGVPVKIDDFVSARTCEGGSQTRRWTGKSARGGGAHVWPYLWPACWKKRPGGALWVLVPARSCFLPTFESQRRGRVRESPSLGGGQSNDQSSSFFPPKK